MLTRLSEVDVCCCTKLFQLYMTGSFNMAVSVPFLYKASFWWKVVTTICGLLYGAVPTFLCGTEEKHENHCPEWLSQWEVAKLCPLTSPCLFVCVCKLRTTEWLSWYLVLRNFCKIRFFIPGFVNIRHQ